MPSIENQILEVRNQQLSNLYAEGMGMMEDAEEAAAARNVLAAQAAERKKRSLGAKWEKVKKVSAAIRGEVSRTPAQKQERESFNVNEVRGMWNAWQNRKGSRMAQSRAASQKRPYSGLYRPYTSQVNLSESEE